jgi:hypothetical protein
MFSLATEVQVALVTGVLGVIALVVNLMFAGKGSKDKPESRAYKKVIDGMERSRASYKALEAMRKSTTASRVILFAGHNSGGIPRPGTPFYTSAIWWSIDDDAVVSNDQIGYYDKLVVDAEYMSMLLEAEKDGVVEIHTKDMRPCLLKKYYHSEGVTHSLVFFVAIAEKKFMYISVAKTEDVPFTEDEVTKLRLMADSVREAIQ